VLAKTCTPCPNPSTLTPLLHPPIRRKCPSKMCRTHYACLKLWGPNSFAVFRALLFIHPLIGRVR
jgi:hypothetical protein